MRDPGLVGVISLIVEIIMGILRWIFWPRQFRYIFKHSWSDIKLLWHWGQMNAFAEIGKLLCELVLFMSIFAIALSENGLSNLDILAFAATIIVLFRVYADHIQTVIVAYCSTSDSAWDVQ